MTAQERYMQVAPMMAETAKMKGAASTGYIDNITVKLAAGDDECGLLRLAALFENLDHLRCLRRTHDTALRFNNASLFPSNRGEGIAEHMRVLKLNRRNGRDLWSEHIRGVQAAAKADFYHCDIDVLTCKVQQAKRCRKLEEGSDACGLTVAGFVDLIPQFGD